MIYLLYAKTILIAIKMFPENHKREVYWRDFTGNGS